MGIMEAFVKDHEIANEGKIKEMQNAKEEMAKPVCPKCGTQINHLSVVSTGTYIQRFRVHMGYGISYEDGDFSGNGEIQNFSCPHCEQVLFESEAEAARFFGLKE